MIIPNRNESCIICKTVTVKLTAGYKYLQLKQNSNCCTCTFGLQSVSSIVTAKTVNLKIQQQKKTQQQNGSRTEQMYIPVTVKFDSCIKL